MFYTLITKILHNIKSMQNGREVEEGGIVFVVHFIFNDKIEKTMLIRVSLFNVFL